MIFMKITLNIPDQNVRKIIRNYFPTMRVTKARLDRIRQVLERHPVAMFEAYVEYDTVNGDNIGTHLWGCPLTFNK